MDIENLHKIYDDSYSRGIYIKEIPEKTGHLAFAGRYEKLKAAGFQDTKSLETMDLMQANLFLSPGYSEESREDSITKAISQMEDSERLGN